jgi:hypothetical protein
VADGKPDFLVVFGRDSRSFLFESRRQPVESGEQFMFADITDSLGLAEVALLLGKKLQSPLPTNCACVSNWINYRKFREEVMSHNLILVGSGRVNLVYDDYESRCMDQLSFQFEYDEHQRHKAVLCNGKERYVESKHRDVGFIQIAIDPLTAKTVLFLAGYHGTGTYAACIGLARKLDQIRESQNVVACVVEGIRTGKRGPIVDDLRIIEIVPSPPTLSVDVKSRIKSLQTQHQRYMENLNLLEEQLARYGMAPPLSLLNEIDYVKARIRQIEEELKKLRQEK